MMEGEGGTIGNPICRACSWETMKYKAWKREYRNESMFGKAQIMRGERIISIIMGVTSTEHTGRLQRVQSMGTSHSQALAHSAAFLQGPIYALDANAQLGYPTSMMLLMMLLMMPSTQPQDLTPINGGSSKVG
jgi:hypothetical protein